MIFRHLTDDETRQIKNQLLIDSYQYYLKSINDNQSVNSTEISTTSFSSSQGSIYDFNKDSCFFVFFDEIKLFVLVSINKSDDNLIFENISNVNIEVLRTAFNLHKQGLMMPWIFQCLYKVFDCFCFFLLFS